ncbi:unnamed protein product [Taenia asiatica]|uniref:BZIP_Maf domain-containing protein n=1 Tax=Taenia asiatica TaxID=60517 RepID=A0A0R3W6V3_TAEAS|nr:unnamed protein product [Taenia asiatica]
MAQKYPTDEELVQMTTMQLRSLLEQHIISQEQHRELRTRRRRLQNRKYARRCAKKKQTEVAELAAAAKKESSAIRVCALDRIDILWAFLHCSPIRLYLRFSDLEASNLFLCAPIVKAHFGFDSFTVNVHAESKFGKSLRQQLSRLNTSVDRLDRQIDSLAKLRISMTEAPFSLRMVAPDGTELGLAHFNSHHLPLLSCEGDESVSMAAANHFIPRICFKTKPLMQRNLCLGKSATTTAATVSTMRVPVPPAGGACGSSVEGQEV